MKYKDPVIFPNHGPHEFDFLELERSASASLAKLTGQPRAVARAALDALNEDPDALNGSSNGLVNVFFRIPTYNLANL